jgi:hypothetical protein
MRRLPAPRTSTAIAVVAAIAVLAVMFPGLGIGQTSTSHGVTPSDVFTRTEPEVCAEVDTFGTNTLFGSEFSVAATSNVLVYFSGERSGRDSETELLLSFAVNDLQGNFVVGTPFEWGLSNNPHIHDSGTVMWSFDAVQPGDYEVVFDARTDPVPDPRGGGNPTAVLENCALTVFVIPVAE